MRQAGFRTGRGVIERLDAIERQTNHIDERNREYDKRQEESRMRFEEFIKRYDRSELAWKEERREMEARVERDRAATEARLAADRKEASERHAASLAEFKQERKELRQELIVQRRILFANFVTIFVGVCGLFAAIVFNLL